VKLVEGTEEHLRALLGLLSDDDRAELDSLGGDAVVIAAKAASQRCWCGIAHDAPIFFAGLRPDGIAWMLATPGVAKAKKFYLRATRQMCGEMQALCPVLRVVVDVRYRRSLRWLEWLGFDLGEPFEVIGRTVREGVRYEMD
jgi:hypothetical protein